MKGIAANNRIDGEGDYRSSNTPTPLTAAIEEAEISFNSAFKGDHGERLIETRTFRRFLLGHMRRAFDLGKQEGMEEGAASAVEYIEASLPTLPDGATSVRLKITRQNLSELLEAARTAHRGDSGNEV